MAPSRAAKYEAWAQPVGREPRTVEAVCFAIGEVLQFFTPEECASYLRKPRISTNLTSSRRDALEDRWGHHARPEVLPADLLSAAARRETSFPSERSWTGRAMRSPMARAFLAASCKI